MLNSERLNTFPLRRETKQGCPPSPVFNTVLDSLAPAVRRGKQTHATEKEAINMSLFANDVIVYRENPKESNNNNNNKPPRTKE